MIGYCATASSGIEIAPARQMKSATTQAKIGLSMKKLGINRYRFVLLGLPCHGRVSRGVGFGKQHRPDLVSGGKLLKALDHDLVAGLQSFGHEPLAVLHRSGAHGLHGDAVVVLDHEHFAAAAAVALDRLLRHRNGVGVDALLDQDADIHARQQFALRIGKLAAQGHLPGMGVDPGVREQKLAGAGIDRAVVEHEAHPGRVGRDAVEFAALERAPELVEFGDRLGEIGVNRIELLDRREIGLVLHHKGAFADQRGADHAVDRGADRRVAQIEPGARDFGLASLDLGFGLAHRRRWLSRSRPRRWRADWSASQYVAPAVTPGRTPRSPSPAPPRWTALRLRTVADRSGKADRRP